MDFTGRAVEGASSVSLPTVCLSDSLARLVQIGSDMQYTGENAALMSPHTFTQTHTHTYALESLYPGKGLWNAAISARNNNI